MLRAEPTLINYYMRYTFSRTMVHNLNAVVSMYLDHVFALFNSAPLFIPDDIFFSVTHQDGHVALGVQGNESASSSKFWRAIFLFRFGSHDRNRPSPNSQSPRTCFVRYLRRFCRRCTEKNIVRLFVEEILFRTVYALGWSNEELFPSISHFQGTHSRDFPMASLSLTVCRPFEWSDLNFTDPDWVLTNFRLLVEVSLGISTVMNDMADITRSKR